MSEPLFKRILVGSDGSPTAANAVARAAELAQLMGATLEIVGAFESESDRPELEGLLRAEAHELRTDGQEVTTSARSGDPVDVLIAIAEERDADLIVVGNRGMVGAKRFLLGSVPDKISHRATCSVLIAHTVGE
jgi:nucleotide-binding universal stress UspA family protein